MPLINMANELVGTIPNLSAFLAKTYVQRAWRDICATRPWSFKQSVAFLNAPVVISAGTVSVTQFSATVIADVTAAAALNAEAAGTPPLIGRQFRNGTMGALYTITGWDNATRTLTLDNEFQAATNATQTYQVYQAYYEPPVENFHRYLSIDDPVNGYTFTNLHVPQGVLDRMDPIRSSQTLPIYAADLDAGPNATVRHEFWPHPIAAQTFKCTCQVTYTTLENANDALPDIVPESLVVARAITGYAIPWALANQGRFPALKGANFFGLKQLWDRHYNLDLARVQILDDGRMLKTKITNQHRLRPGFPIDANWLQNHDWRR